MVDRHVLENSPMEYLKCSERQTRIFWSSINAVTDRIKVFSEPAESWCPIELSRKPS